MSTLRYRYGVPFPAFDRALAELHQFLELQQIHRGTLHWIFREDVALRDRSLLVSARLPRERTTLVAETYSRAVAREAPGVVLGAEGIDDDAVYCTIFVPVSDDDAERRMIKGLKLSMPAALAPVVTLDQATWARAARHQTSEQLAFLDDRFQPSAAYAEV